MMRYDIFVSYHRGTDGRTSIALERALKRFAKPVFRLRALEVFRDDSALDATPALWEPIAGVLKQSRFFLLIASPGAAASAWVTREIEYWLETHSPGRLMIALTEGEIGWDNRAGDFDWNRTTALPRTLGGRFNDEPRWIDMRWSRTTEDLALTNPAFHAAVADIAAPVHGRAKDTLIGEDVAQHRRLTRLTGIVVATLSLLVVGLSLSLGYAVLQRNEAQRQTVRAEDAARQAIGRQLALEAQVIQRELTGSAAASRAAALAIESWRLQPSRTAYEAAVTALEELPVWLYPSNSEEIETSKTIGFLPQDGRIVHTSDLITTTNQRGARLSVWAPDGSREIYRRNLPGSVWDSAPSPAGNRIAISIYEGPVLLLDSADGSESASIDFGTLDRSIKFGPDGRLLLIETRDRGAGIFNGESGARLSVVAADRPVSASALSPDGRQIAVASDLSHFIDDKGEYQLLDSESARLTVFDTQRFNAVRELILPARINDVAFSPDSRWIAVASVDGMARVLDAATLDERLQITHGAAVQSVDFSHDGALLATSSTDTTARVIRLDSGEELFRVVHSRSVLTAIFSPDDRFVATGSMDGGVRVVETRSGRLIARMEHRGWIQGVLFSPDGRYLLTQAGSEVARLSVIADGGQELSLQIDSPVTALAYSPDNGHLLVASATGMLRMLETATLSPLWTHKASAPLWAVDFAPDATRVAAVGDSGQVQVFRAADGTPLLDVTLGGSLTGVAFDPRGGRLSVGSRAPALIRVLDADSAEALVGYEYFEPHGEGVCCLVYSPSGNRLALGDPIGFRVLDGNDYHEVAMLDSGGRTMGAATDPSGRILAVGTDNSGRHRFSLFQMVGEKNSGFVRIYSQKDGAELQAYEYGAAIYAVDIDRTGSLVASGSSKGVGHIVRLQDGLEIARVTRPAPITAIRFAPDGEYFATGTEQGSIDIWSMPDNAIRRLCTQRVGNNLTKDEWNRYLGALGPWSPTCENWITPQTDDLR